MLCGHLVRDEIKERKKGKFVIVSPQFFSPTIVRPLNQTWPVLVLVIFIVMSSWVFLDFYSLFLFRYIKLFLEHFYSFTCVIVYIIFHNSLYVIRAIFSSSFSLDFCIENFFCTVFILCKFSLDQF